MKALPAWTPLRDVSTSAASIGGVLYRLDHGAYLVCVPYNQHLEEVDGGPFITMVLWAETDGAARRTQLMEIEADQEADLEPPHELLLPGLPVTYGGILRESRAGAYPELCEWAEYRVATDGAFVQQTINVPPLSFHFRRPDAGQDHRCYAIHCRLSYVP